MDLRWRYPKKDPPLPVLPKKRCFHGGQGSGNEITSKKDRMADNTEYRVGAVGPSGSIIKEIIIQGVDFLVYMDEEDNIQWSTEPAYTDFHPQFGSIQNRVSFWESVCNKLFSKYDAYDYKCLLAEAYARIIDEKDLELSNDIIALTINRIEKNGKEILKQDYILSSFACTVVVMA